MLPPNPQALHIRNGRIVDPSTGRDEVGDVWIENGRVTDAPVSGAQVFDAQGLVVAPGLVDIHVHFRDPGQTHKEDIRSGARSAAAGGFTTVVCMPNTQPVCDSPGTIQLMKATIKRSAVVRVHTTGCLTKGMAGEELAPMGSLKNSGVVALTDDGRCVQSAELMRRILEYAQMLDLPVYDHCQDESLTQGAVMAEGEVSLKLGLRGWPPAAEELIVMRNAILARETGAHVHCQHISSGYSVEILKWAKSQDIPITGELSPHHMALTEQVVDGFNVNAKMNPPLRSETHRQDLIQGLLDGWLDCICTDHAPHARHEKEVEFDYAPFGIVGLETSLAVCLEELYHSGKASLSRIVDWLSTRPAAIGRLEGGSLQPGAPGDVILFDPDQRWTVDADAFFSKSSNSPWAGRSLRGRTKATVAAGWVIFDGKDVIEREAMGPV